MNCIFCNNKSIVRNSASKGKHTIRERQCEVCNKIFYTEERSPASEEQYGLRTALYSIKEERRRQIAKSKKYI